MCLLRSASLNCRSDLVWLLSQRNNDIRDAADYPQIRGIGHGIGGHGIGRGIGRGNGGLLNADKISNIFFSPFLIIDLIGKI